MKQTTDYASLIRQAESLLEGENHRIANAANLSALIYETLPQINWAGFYFLEDGELVVGPFQGRPACVRIALDQGVCGAAASTRQIQRVADVDAFEGHVVCDTASRSEIVFPLIRNGEVLGVLDIDSPVLDRFDEEDQRGLAALAELYIRSLS